MPLQLVSQMADPYNFEALRRLVLSRNESVDVGIGNNLKTSMSSSSQWDANWTAAHCFISGGTNAWIAKDLNTSQFIQVEVAQDKVFTKVTTQGRMGVYQQWVEKYQIIYSRDGAQWFEAREVNSGLTLFQGNSDQCTKATNTLVPFIAKYVRLIPLKWHEHISMRMEMQVLDD